MTDRDLVTALCKIEDGLTDWEVEFVDSIAKQVLDGGRTLTDRQREIAEQINEAKGL